MGRAHSPAIRVLIAALLVVAPAVAQESRTASRPTVDTPAILAARAKIAQAEESSGPDAPELILLCRELALLLRNAGRSDDAIAPARRSLAIQEQHPAATRAGLADGRKVLAVILHDAHRYAEALPVARAAADDAVAGWGTDTPQTAQVFFILGGIAKMAGQLEEAEAALRRAVLAEEVTAPIQRIQFLHGLGEVLSKLGKYGEARSIFLEADALISETADVPLLVRANHEAGLGSLEDALGRLGNARLHFERQLEFVRAMTPVPYGELGVALHNLARAAEGETRYEDELRLQDEALAAFARQPSDPRVTSLLADAAHLAVALGRFERAAALAERILAMMRTSHDDEPRRRGRALECAAAAKHGMGQPAEALPIFDEALACAQRGQDDYHQLEAVVRSGKGRALSTLGRTIEARACFLSASSSAANALVGHSALLSEAERLSLLRNARRSFDLWLSSVVDDPLEAETVAAQVLAWKGRVLRFMQIERSRLRAREDPEIAALRHRLTKVQNDLAAVVVPSGASRPSIEPLMAEREEIERALARLAAGGPSTPVTPADVSGALGDDEALVDYLSYARATPADAKPRTGDDVLLAVVYRRGRAPRVIALGPAAAACDAIEAHLRITARDVRPDPAAAPLARAAAARARDEVWTRVEPAIQGARRLFIVPDGFLAALPFETLPAADGPRVLLEDFEITYLLTVQDLLEPFASGNGRGALLVGDVDYGEAPASESREITAARSELGLPLSPLPRTKQEIDAIAAALARAGAPFEHLLRIVGREATESRIKAAMAGKQIVHLATHGLFLRSPGRGGNQASRAFRVESAFEGALPSLRSGIALAGINSNGGGSDDGLLTAAEVAWCDLSACDLAVISSCESGLGISWAGDSLLGLRRSLHLAGARSTVTALWNVDDAATADLMGAFYEGLLVKNMPKAAALREAKLQALQAARAAGAARGNPGTWGAFVLEGGWK